MTDVALLKRPDAIPPLPPGFTLDQPKAASGVPALPPGFTLDQPAAPPPGRVGMTPQPGAPASADVAASADAGGSFLPEVGKGVAGGAVSTTGTMLKGAAGQNEVMIEGASDAAKGRLRIMDALDRGEKLPSNAGWGDELDTINLYPTLTPEERKQFRQSQERVIKAAPPAQDVTQTPLYKSGQKIEDFSAEKFKAAKDYENSWTRTLSEGLGSTIPFVAGGEWGALGGGAAASAGQQVEDAVKHGATKEQIVQAIKQGSIPGLTEELPLEHLFDRVPVGSYGKLVSALIRVGKQHLAEAGQEGMQQFMQNLIARSIYNPEQDIFEQVPQSAAVGGFVGAAMKGTEEIGSAVAGIGAKAPTAAPAAAPPLPAGFKIDTPQQPAEHEPLAVAPAAPESAARGDSPPAVASPVANPAQRATLRKMQWNDADIDGMSQDEIATEVQTAEKAGLSVSQAELDSAGQYRPEVAGGPPSQPAAQGAAPPPVAPAEVGAGAPPPASSPATNPQAEALAARIAQEAAAARQPAPAALAQQPTATPTPPTAAPVPAAAPAGEWRTFPKESGTAGVPRADMPQIKSIHRGALVNFLAARGIAHSEETVAPRTLKPTQAEFSTAKIDQATKYGGTDRSILVSSDGYVLDGHHQWLAKLVANQPVKVIRLDAPIADLMSVVPQFPSATKAPKPLTFGPKQKPQGKPLDIVQYLASQGGITDYKGELRGLDLSKRFVPGYGRLLRKNGLTLDHARESAAEQGYFDHIYGDPDTAMARSTVRDLLDLIDQNERGNRAFTQMGGFKAEAPKPSSAAGRADAALADSARSELVAFGLKADDPFTDRVVAIMLDQHIGPAEATEQAAMQNTQDEGIVVPGDDMPFFGGTNETHPTAPSEGGPLPGAPSQPVERPGAQGQAEGTRPPAPAGGEGGAAVGSQPHAAGALEGQPVSGQGASVADIAGAAFDEAQAELATETGAEGKPQTLLPGVAPVTDKDRAAVKGAKPLAGKVPQKEPGGMFGDEQNQTDISDFLQPPRKPATIKSAATSAAEGADAAIKGLMELFGGKGAKLSSGFTFDEETYARAKPLFKQAITKFAEAGRDVAEMVKHLVRHMAQLGMSAEARAQMRPYVIRFVEDVQDGKITLGEPAPASKPAETPAPASDDLLKKLRNRLLDPDGAFATINQARAFLLDNGWKAQNAEVANKEAEELIEHAVVLAARVIVKSSKDPQVVYARLVSLYQRQPRLGSRTSASMAEQAYSTPVPLAYVASRLAGITSETSVLEPTAGNGALLIEANPKNVTANELNPTRAAALMAQGFRATQQDATEGNLRHAGYPVDVVIANPPFGAVRSGGESKVFEIGDYRTTAVDQAISMRALEHMKPNGRAVLIVGSVKEGTPETRAEGYGSSQKRKFYKRLYDNYNVVQHFTVSGDLYQKQGAGWPVDVIVIDGKGKSSLSLPAAAVPAVANTWAELKGYLNERGERLPDQSGDQVPVPAPSVIGPTGGNTVGGRPAGGGGSTRPAAGPRIEPAPSSLPPDRGESQSDGELGGNQNAGPVGGGVDTGGADNATPATLRQPRLNTAANATGQVPYRPYSRWGKSLETLVPGALGASMDESLARIEAVHGNIDDYVSKALGYTREEIEGTPDKPGVFSAEQVDALALAINNVENGDAFIIGDQTGIGKGRVVAGAILYAHKRGMVPVFVTEKTDLYGDMYRDIDDIQWAKKLGHEPVIFMTNSDAAVPLDDEAVDWIIARDQAKLEGRAAPPKAGKFTTPQGAKVAEKRMGDILSGVWKPDVIFTTYDQMSSVNKGETSRRRFMDQVAPRSFLIMDESHNAGGQGPDAAKRAKKGSPPQRSAKFREWVQKAKAVMYSSATYAKNPQVMDLYSRTDMAKAVTEAKDLPELIKKGKVPLQQIVASMLAKSGQYARREKSFEGVEYGLEVAPVDQKNYADFAGATKLIYQFDRSISKFRKNWIKQWLAENGAAQGMDSGIGDLAANSTEFASIMHNMVNQMLLSIKAEAAAARTIAALEAGEKPVIALSKTAASFISDYADDQEIKLGDPINIDFRDVVRRYLERTLRITIKDSRDVKTHIYIPPAELGEFQSAYEEAQASVEALDLSGLPVSPIDWIRHRITEAGFTISEVTGRSSLIQYGKDGKMTLESRPTTERGAPGKRVSIRKFNDGALDVIILNRSGATGVSLHAKWNFKDRRRRRMILAEADPNIDTHMQMLGRVHRTGQVIAPAYTQLSADIPAEARPTAVLMRKMASLNANTTAARKSAFTADVVDFMNEYGDQAAIQWARENPLENGDLGDPINFDDNGKATGENQIQRLTGRIMLLDPQGQQALLDELTRTYNGILAQKEALGENALEAKALDLQAEPISKVEIRPGTGPSPFEASANLETMRVKSVGRAMKPREVVVKVADEIGLPAPDANRSFANNMEMLERAGRVRMEKLNERIMGERAQYEKTVIAGLKNADAKTAAATKLEEQTKHWRDIARIAPVGTMVNIASQGEDARTTPAIVLSIDQQTHKGKGVPNPVAASSWTVTLAIPDTARQLTIPFSQIVTGNEESETAVTLSGRAWTDSLPALEKMFDAAAREGKEERLIATGNLLAAYDQLSGKGQIIQFTNANGDVQPGIMMPRTYSVEQFASERRIRFATSDQVLNFLDRAADKKVVDSRDFITLIKNGNSFDFQVDAGRAKGGRYFTDDSVRQIYDRWQKSGGTMNATVNRDTAQKLVAAMQAIGAKFVAPSEPVLATEIVHGKGSKQYQAARVAAQNGEGSPSAVPPLTISEADKAKVREIVQRVAGVEPSLRYWLHPDVADPAWGQTEPSYQAGSYDFVDDLVTIATYGGTLTTAYHEAFHRLQNLFLNARERAILAASTERLREYVRIGRGDTADRMSQIELEAEAFAMWSEAMDRQHPIEAGLHIAIRRVWQRIKNVLREINSVIGYGRRYQPDVTDVFANARVGLTARRTPLAKGHTATEMGFQAPSDQTQSPAFKRWFGNSKVTNDDGSPQIVYHNTHREFDAFDRMMSAKLHPREGHTFNNLGMWFSSKAENEGGAGAYGPKQMPVYLSMQKPFVIHGHGSRDLATGRGKRSDAAWDKFWRLWTKLTDEKSSPATQNGSTVREPTRTARRDPEPMRQWLKEHGYDGIILRNTFADTPSEVSTPQDFFIVLEPEQIKGVNNRGTFDPKDARYQFQAVRTDESVARVPSIPPRAAVGALVTQRINALLTSGVGAVKTLSPRDRRTAKDQETAKDYLTRKMEDYLHPLRMMQEAGGHALNELNNIYMNARIAGGEAKAHIQIMHDKYVRPMVDAMSAGRVTVQELHQFAYAMHAQERNEVVGSRNPVGSDLHNAIADTSLVGASGMSTDRANQILDEFRLGPKIRALREAHAHLRAMLNAELRNARRAGLIDDETYATLTEQWQNYVPLKGFDGQDEETGFWKPGSTGFDVRGKEWKTALGRFSEAENVMANAIVQSEQSIIRQHENSVGKAALRFANEFDPEGEHYMEVYWAGPDGMGDIVKAQNVYRRKIGKDGKVHTYRVPNPFSSRDDVLATKVGGKTYYIRFKDPKVGYALRKLSVVQLGFLSRVVRHVTVWQSIVNTRANPAFIPLNVIRDVLTAGIHLLGEGFTVGQIARVMKDIPKAYGALWRHAKGKPGNTEWDRYAAEWHAAGGKISFSGYATMESTLRDLEKQVDRGINGQNELMAGYRAVTGFIGMLNDTGENGTRLAAYVAARRDQGRSPKEAAFMARDLTVDFEKHGELGPLMNSWFVFFNASLQGNVNVARRVFKSKAVRRAVAAILLAGLMQHFWNWLMAGEDDAGENYYAKMLKNEPWKLERQFVFFIPNSGGRYVSFPMPWGYNAFYHAGTQGGAVMTGQVKPLAALADSLRVYWDAFNPIGSGSLWSMASPTITDPIVDLKLNENFYGGPIHPSPNPFDRSPPPAAYQSFSTTNPIFNKIAEGLNAMSFGDQVMPGAIDMYPDSIEHLFGYAVGGFGRFLAQGVQTAGDAMKGEVHPEKVPWVRSFYGQYNKDSQRNEYFKQREAVLSTAGYMKSYQDAGDQAGVDKLQTSNPVEVAAYSAFNQAEKTRKAINRQRRQIDADTTMSSADRQKANDELDAQELDAMKQARAAYAEASK